MSSAEPGPARVAVIIPNHNGSVWLPGCFEGLARQEFTDFSVVFVDNGSSDGSLDLARASLPEAKLLSLGKNLGFAAAVNRGIEASRSEYVALLNTDTIAAESWLRGLVHTLAKSPSEVAAAAPRMLRMDDPDTVDDAGDALAWTGAARKMGHGEPATRFVEPREVFSVSGGASLFRRSFLEAMGGFDEAFFAYLEDVDLGLRGRICGYRFVLEPSAEVLHKGQGSAISRGSYVRLVTRNRLLLFAKSVPATLLLKNLGRLAYGQVYFLLVYRRPLQSFAGYAGFLPLIPHVLRERRKLAARRRISREELDALLRVDMSEPPLRELLARRWRRLAR